jgi:DNA-binding MarR family transcriptional regulator
VLRTSSLTVVRDWNSGGSLATLSIVTAATRSTIAELAAVLRPPLLRLTRLIRNQRVDESVTLTQVSAMACLAKHGPMSAGELAAQERVQPPSMTKVLANLEERGLVRREAHPNDRRQAIIAITDAGNDLLESERRSRDLWLTQQLARLTPEERALLRKIVPVLDKLAQL